LQQGSAFGCVQVFGLMYGETSFLSSKSYAGRDNFLPATLGPVGLSDESKQLKMLIKEIFK
jgi:hypothetical protein